MIVRSGWEVVRALEVVVDLPELFDGGYFGYLFDGVFVGVRSSSSSAVCGLGCCGWRGRSGICCFFIFFVGVTITIIIVVVVVTVGTPASSHVPKAKW